MQPPGTPASAPAPTEPDQWLAPVRRGVLLTGSALAIRWFLAGLAVLLGLAHLGRSALVPSLPALVLVLDAAFAGIGAGGVFLLTARGVPRVSVQRWRLRSLALADLGLSLARAVIVVALGAFDGQLFAALVQLLLTVALLARLGELCDAGHERVAAVWARSGAMMAIGITVVTGAFLYFAPSAQLALSIAWVWSLGVIGVAVVIAFSTTRAARWL